MSEPQNPPAVGPQPKLPETSQEAAQVALDMIGPLHMQGFGIAVRTPTGLIPLEVNPIEGLHLRGLLQGYVNGTLQYGDPRIVGGLNAVMTGLQAAAKKLQEVEKQGVNPADSQPATDSKTVKARQNTMAVIDEMAARVANAIFITAQFGLTMDKPLSRENERGLGFNRDIGDRKHADSIKR